MKYIIKVETRQILPEWGELLDSLNKTMKDFGENGEIQTFNQIGTMNFPDNAAKEDIDLYIALYKKTWKERNGNELIIEKE